MAKRYNMRLVSRQRFSEFFQEKVKKEHHRHLMMKMMALEVTPHLSSEELFSVMEHFFIQTLSVSAVSL